MPGLPFYFSEGGTATMNMSSRYARHPERLPDFTRLNKAGGESKGDRDLVSDPDQEHVGVTVALYVVPIRSSP